MTKFLALNISASEDGFMAGPNQSEESPLGEKGELLHSWAFATQAFQEWHGESRGSIDMGNGTIFVFITEGVDRTTDPIISGLVVHQSYLRI